MAIWLAVLAAITIGASDFVNGIIGRRDPTGSTLIVIYLATAAAGLALAPTGPTDWSAGLVWAAVLGILWPCGIFALMHGVAFGRVVVIIPVAGVLSATVPVVVDLASGPGPAVMVLAGVVIGVAALVVIGVGERDDGAGVRTTWWSVAMGAIGGTTTGLAFVVTNELVGYGMAPLMVTGLVAAGGSIVILAIMGRLRRPPAENVLPAVALGVVLAVAYASLVIGMEKGTLTGVAVISSQYPVVTIFLAAVVWRQRPRGIQYLGVAMSLFAIAMIAAGS
ncbi:EamA family transporter [bacterium]|nr:EamA family transporter [bacterium]